MAARNADESRIDLAYNRYDENARRNERSAPAEIHESYAVRKIARMCGEIEAYAKESGADRREVRTMYYMVQNLAETLGVTYRCMPDPFAPEIP